MPKKRIAIIGGGIGGLTALHELRKYPDEVEAELFEATERVGGRIRTEHVDGIPIDLGASYFHQYYNGFFHLMGDYRYCNRATSLHHGRAGFLLDGKVVGLDKKGILWSLLSSLVTEGLSMEDVKSLQALKDGTRETVEQGNLALQAYCNNEDAMDFADVLPGFPAIERGYKRPFCDFALQLTGMIQTRFIRPLVRSTLFTEPGQINETVGKAIFVDTSKLITLAGGLQTLPDEIYSRHGDYIALGTPVLGIEDTGNGYGITTTHEKKEFDAVVSGIPLSRLPEMLPDFKTDMEYSGVRMIVVKGNVRKGLEGFDKMFIGEGDSGIDHISRKGPNIYKISTKIENPRYGDFFTAYEVLREADWEEAVPIIRSSTTIPSMATRQNFYLVGDYVLPCMEMAVDTGYKAAMHILRDL